MSNKKRVIFFYVFIGKTFLGTLPTVTEMVDNWKLPNKNQNFFRIFLGGKTENCVQLQNKGFDQNWQNSMVEKWNGTKSSNFFSSETKEMTEVINDFVWPIWKTKFKSHIECTPILHTYIFYIDDSYVQGKSVVFRWNSRDVCSEKPTLSSQCKYRISKKDKICQSSQDFNFFGEFLRSSRKRNRSFPTQN
jgi:hypothetical protein